MEFMEGALEHTLETLSDEPIRSNHGIAGGKDRSGPTCVADTSGPEQTVKPRKV